MATLEKLEDLIYRISKETEQRAKETDRRMQENAQESARRMQETERELKARAIQSDREYKELWRQLAGVTGSVALFAESMVYPSLIRLFRQRGLALTGTYHRLRERRNGGTMEIDALGVGETAVVAVEVKVTLETEDVKDFLESLPRFFDFFPRFRGLKLYAAVAGMSVTESVARYAYKNGLFVLAQSGENMKILNDEKFKPRAFNEPANGVARRKK